MKQGYNDRMDESLSMRDGSKSQSMKDRRDESKGMEKAMGKRAYGAVKTMKRGRKSIR
jgi:hypothetical protein